MSHVTTSDFLSEAQKGFSHRTSVEESARCLLCHDAPCSKACPAQTNPSKFIRSIRFRNIKGAIETIRENNPLAGTCARVCPASRLCEGACSRGKIDSPVQIAKLQRYAIEQEKIFQMQVVQPASPKPQKIACVGSGPASLSCAATLARQGYAVTIFEKEEKAGGILTYGIVPSRLPQTVVDDDIELIKKLGVQFVLNHPISSLEELKNFDAICLGIGLSKPNRPNISGYNLEGVLMAQDFLKEAREKKSYPGEKVIIIGGGDVALDSAVAAKLLGAKNVSIIYRRTIEEAPANMDEFHYALSLGITVTPNMAPLSIEKRKDDLLMSFKGRDGVSEMKLVADKIIFAIGQKADDLSSFGLALTEKGLISVDSLGKTNLPLVFAAGDITGSHTVVEAVSAGKKVAQAMINAFNQKGVSK